MFSHTVNHMVTSSELISLGLKDAEMGKIHSNKVETKRIWIANRKFRLHNNS